MNFNNNCHNKIKFKNQKMNKLINKDHFFKVQLSVKLQNNYIKINKYLRVILIIIIKTIINYRKIICKINFPIY